MRDSSPGDRYSRHITHVRNVSSLFPLLFLLCILRFIAVPFALFSSWIWEYQKRSRARLNLFRLFLMGYSRTIGRASLKLLYAKFEEIATILPRVDLVGGEYLDECRKTGRGIILVSVHSTGSRLLQHWINQYDESWTPYLAKYYPDLPDRRWLMQEEHQKLIYHGRLLNARYLGSAVKILRAGGTVVLAQDLSHPKAESIPFLDKTMKNPLGAARLAEISDAMLLPVTLGPRVDRCRWRIHFLPPIDFRNGGTKEKLKSAVESLIMIYPELWDGWRELWKTTK